MKKQEVKQKASWKVTWEVFLFILKCTFVGFGGGNALMPVIKKEAVDRKKWLDDKEFDNLVITSNMIPGPSVVEALSYISMKQLGKFRGALIALVAILPHIMMFVALFVVAEEFLPVAYLYTIAASVMPVIVGILIIFGWRYIKQTKKELPFWVWFSIFIFTMCFTLFVPSPWNIPAIVMVLVIFCIFVYSFFTRKKGGDK